MTTRSGRCLGLLLGAGADAVLADPRRGHPVATFGRAAAALESKVWADTRRRGVLYSLGCIGAAAAVGSAAERSSRLVPLHVATVAVSTWVVLGGTTLAREGVAMTGLLDTGDLPAARRRLAHLCGRDASTLDAQELARAAVESVAENTSDAMVAPMLWGAVLGVPGLLAYRAVNTLDAMVGHRSPRHARFGWAAARLDDLANLVPSRLTGVLASVLAPLVGGSPAASLRTMRRDGAAHPSPNAGPCEAAFAGALGITLGGATAYGDRVEWRGPLGDGPPPQVHDISRAVRLSRAVGLVSVAVSVALAALTVRLTSRTGGGSP